MIIKISREKRMVYSARKIKLFINDALAGELNNGDTIEANLSERNNIISFKIGNKTMAVASVDTGACGDTPVQIVCWASNNDGIEFYSNSPAVQKQMDASGKSSAGWVVLAIIAAAIVLFFIFQPRLVFFFPL